MYIFAEPVTEEQITTIQTANDAKIQEFEQQLCGTKEEEDQGWENLQANVQDAMDEDLRDPNHDEGRQDLDPILTSTKKDNAGQLASSDDFSPIDPNNPMTTAAAEDEEDVDDDSDEDEGIEEEEEEEEEDDDEDEEEEQDDDDEVLPEGILVNNAVGRDTETYADARSDVEDQYLQHEVKDGVMSPKNPGNQGELAAGAGQETEKRAVDEESTKAESPEGFDSTSSSEGGNRSAIACDSKQESAETDAAMGGFDGDNGEDSQKTVAGDRPESSARPESKEVLALTLTIRNKVNESYVLRPENLGAKDQWTMEYSLDEVPKPDRAWSLYQACKMRRRKKLDDVNRRGESDDEVDAYIRKLREMSRKGAEWRKKQDEKDSALPVQVLG